MNIDHILDELNAAQGKPLEANKPMVEVIYTLIGTAYRCTEDPAYWIPRVLGHFLERDGRLTVDTRKAAWNGMLDAQKVAEFCRFCREEKD